MESKSIINCHWPNKLDSVDGSCFDVDNYVVLHTHHPPAYIPTVQLVESVGSVELSVILN